MDMLEKEEYGKYHATNEGGYISWCDFAKEIFRQAGMDVKVLPVSSAEYPEKAKRPTNSRLEKKKLEEHGFTRLPDWKDALGRKFDRNQDFATFTMRKRIRRSRKSPIPPITKYGTEV